MSSELSVAVMDDSAWHKQPACSACLFALSFSAFLTFFLFSFARIRASGRQHVSPKRQWSSMVFQDYQLII